VLCHSPLTTGAAWGRLPSALADLGLPTLVLDISSDDHPPYAAAYIADAAKQIAAAAPPEPVVLVGHSGAGPLLPQIGFARRAARHPVTGYVLFDAMLPRAGQPTRLDLLHAEDHEHAHELAAKLDHGGRFPDWDDAQLMTLARPRGKDFFTEPLPHPPDWPEAPVAYVRTSDAYAWHARVARGRGWPVIERDLWHFPGLTAADEAAEAVAAAVDALAG
jgi:hypothetical protein